MSNTSGYNFPDDNAPQSVKKDKQWNLDFQRALYSSSDNGMPYDVDSRKLRYQYLRRESEGLIDVDKFKPIVMNDGSTALVELSWDVSSVVPTFVKNILGQFTNQSFRVDFSARNPEAKTELDKKKRQLHLKRIKAKNAELIKEVTGEMPETEGKEIFETEEEIDLYLDLTWKQAECIAMENAVSYIHRSNDEEQIKRKIYKDLIDLSIGAKRVYYDENLDIRERYVDPERLITTFARKDDFTDIKAAGELLDIEIDDLAVMSDFTEEELRQIAQQNCGYNGVDWNTDWNRYYPVGGQRRPYGGFKVRVLDAEYFSHDTYIYEKKKQQKGDGYFFVRAKREKQNGSEYIKKRVKNVYKSKWIVGTNFIFDYGLKENMTVEKVNGMYSTDRTLSFFIYAPDIYDMENKSLVEKMIPYSNNIIILQLKAQQLVAQAHPAGMATDMYAALSAIAGLGEEGLTPRDLNIIYKQTGDYYFASRDENGEIINMPFREIPESQLSSAPNILSLVHHNLQMIENVTGVPISTIGSPDKDALVGIEKQKLFNRNNSLRYIDYGYKNILERSSKEVSLMVQDSLKNGKGRELAMAIGNEDVDILSLSEKMQLTEYGIFVNVLPDQLEIAVLEDQLTKAVVADRLLESDAMKIKRIAKVNVELAERYIEIWENKYRVQKERAQIEALKQQSLAQAQGGIEVEKAKQQTLQTEYALKMKMLEMEYMLKFKQSDIDFKEDKQLKMLDIKGKERLVEMSMQNEKQKENSESISGSIPSGAGIRQPQIPQPPK